MKFPRQNKPSIFTKAQRSSRKLSQVFDYPFWDIYHWLLVISWWQFLALISFFFIIVNILFACTYLMTGEGIANAEAGSFKDAFFFSVQTLSTIGYGAMHPQTILAQILVTIEVLVGLLFVAMATGLVFARFAQPKARLIFSNVAVITPFNGIPTLMLRIANQRKNHIIEAQVQVSILKNQTSAEGMELRRFYNLPLVRSQSPSFRLSWLIMHPIDIKSPLYRETAASLIDQDTEIIVILTGLDETSSQTIHARYSYSPYNIRWGMRFVDILGKTDDGRYFIDYEHFHDTISIATENYSRSN